MRIDILTIFPQIFNGPFEYGVTKIAKEKGFVDINVHYIRDFCDDTHKKVDDYPYGGGPGMVLKPEPIFRGVKSVSTPETKVVLLSPGGNLYTQTEAHQLAKEKHLVFICGRYQGVDERVKSIVDMELSIGNYVLSGGEIPCMVVVESIARLVPGVLHNEESINSDSMGELDSPLYTRPPEFEGMKVPEVLLSGNHIKIKKWQQERKKVWT